MKTVLIITDESVETAKMATAIKTALKGNKVSVKSASEFQGNDILPADVFFLGCEKPKPASFDYLADLLKHINLAGRFCGVFTPGSEKALSAESAVKYLTGLVKHCDVSLNPESLAASGKKIEKWARAVVSGEF